MASLPYEEPSIVAILKHSSFLFLLNVVNSILDQAVNCGLLGQILLGIAWGVPGGNFLSVDLQHAIVQLGYIGLILLVYEGGLSVPIKALKANIVLSLCVALTGIAVPIALSFVLVPLMGATSLQAFAAGAALCSTSLGTTFTVLSTSGLADTRLGTVLSTAAIMDDVVGLVILQVITNLGAGHKTIAPSIVIRPLLVSLAFAVSVPIVCRFIVRSVRMSVAEKSLGARLRRAFQHTQMRFLLHALLLFGLVTAGSYAGTSNLFTAYLTGTVVNWWDADQGRLATQEPGSTGHNDDAAFDHPLTETSTQANTETLMIDNQIKLRPKKKHAETDPSHQLLPTNPDAVIGLSGMGVYGLYLAQPVNRILKPFFFASIGFSIPIANLFSGSLVWRGLIYAVLMALGKLVCGLWLIRLPWMIDLKMSCVDAWARSSGLVLGMLKQKSKVPTTNPQPVDLSDVHSPDSGVLARNETRPAVQPEHQREREVSSALETSDTTGDTQVPTTPVSLYPAGILGSAMVARGEIGFLIASVAESNRIWGEDAGESSSDIFIVVTWAIFLCTFIGPISVGLIVRRLNALEKEREAAGNSRAVLGDWGLVST